MLVLQVIRLAAFGDINTSTQAKSYARSLTKLFGVLRCKIQDDMKACLR